MGKGHPRAIGTEHARSPALEEAIRIREGLRQVGVRAAMAGFSVWERLESGISFNLLAPSFAADPHAVYRSLRERDPVHRSRLFRGWLFTRYDDVQALLRDPRLSTDIRHQSFYPSIQKAQLRAGRTQDELDQPTMLNSDAPRHTRLRGLGFPTDADLRASIKATRELAAYLEPIAEKRRLEPRDDLLSGLLAAEEAGDRLSLDEVFQSVMLLLVAGNETTTKLIGNALLALLQHPEQLELLRQHPDLIDMAVDELLRWDGPIHATGRSAVESFEFQGASIAQGQMVMIGLAAANRDPAVFDEPECLDITRSDNPHLSLGHGMHFCLGASLARLEARTALLGLIQRYPALKLATDRPRWGSSAVLRGLAELPVRV